MVETINSNNTNKDSDQLSQETEEIQEKLVDFEDAKTEQTPESDETDKKGTSEGKIMKFMKSLLPSVVIAFGTFLLVFLLHFLGAFNKLELQLYDFRLKLRGPVSGMDSKSALPSAEGFIDLTEPFVDANLNRTWDEAEPFTDTNSNKNFDTNEPYVDVGNGVWD